MKTYAKLIALLSIIFVAIGATILGVYLNSIEKGNNFKLEDYIVRSEGNGVTIVSYEGEDTSITISSKIGGKKLVKKTFWYFVANATQYEKVLWYNIFKF